MKRASKWAILVAIALSTVMVLPTAYAVEAGGEVAGSVILTAPGIPLTECANTKYTFQDVVLRGAIRLNNGSVFVGSLDTDLVAGNSTMCETTSAGKGTVNSELSPAVIKTAPSAGNIGNVTGSFWGTYVRTESVVVVDLQVTVSINSGPSQTFPVKVRAQFTPTKVSTSGITEASFVGEWSTV